MTEKWLLKKRNFDPSIFLEKGPFDERMRDLLARRDLESKDQLINFLEKDPSHEYDPFLLRDMKVSTEMINHKIKNKEKILLVLDYDVDGIISGAIAYMGLKGLGALCSCIFPDRVNEGYGLNHRIIEHAIKNNYSTIITFDNGIAAFESVEMARKNNLDIIITDHHEVPQVEEKGLSRDRLVNATAIINPKQTRCEYPYKHICGAMIAYKLIQALYLSRGIPLEKIKDLYNLVSIATICDVMELRDENRIFVSQGLDGLSKSQMIGIKSLLSKLNLDHHPNLTINDIGFKLGPVLNSSGRLETADMALRLLVSENQQDAEKMADHLVALNEERKKLTKEATALAQSTVRTEALTENNIIILLLSDIHESLAGIVAGRIKEEYNLPVIVFTNGSEYIKGSARSPDHVNIFSELSKFKKYLSKFGGHAAAAGLSIEKDQFESFKDSIIKHFNSLDVDNTKNYYVDDIIDIGEANLQLAKKIKVFEPTGKGNPSLLFSSLHLTLKKVIFLGDSQSALKLDFSNGLVTKSFISFAPQKTLDYIKYKMNFEADHDIIEGKPEIYDSFYFDLLYKVNINYYKNNEYLNLELVSIR